MTGTNVTPTSTAPPPRKALNPTVKFVLELGPLVLFFAANSKPQLFHGLVGELLPTDFPPDKAGMLTATAVLIPVTFIALVISFVLTRRLPLMPVITTGMVLVFGALTLWLQDKTFIEIKLTIIYCMFGAALLGSMAFGKLLLPIVLDAAFHLDDAGWRTLTVRWGSFFFALAALNEILRHALSWDQWVAFKTFAVLPITLAFALAQAPLIMRHETKDDEFSDEM
jgi:intracellular septation protein